MKTKDRAEWVRLLKDWTRAAGRMTAGLEVGAGALGGLREAPPDDTGEALGLEPFRLTLTFGFGPSLFDLRFGLGGRRPGALVDLSGFPRYRLDPARSGGDLCVQASADDPGRRARHPQPGPDQLRQGRGALVTAPGVRDKDDWWGRALFF